MNIIALQNKISSCTKVKLHHLDSNLTLSAIQQFLQQNQLDSQTNRIHINPHDKTAIIDFNSHDIAMKFYLEHNFQQYIGTKILNISLDISLNKN